MKNRMIKIDPWKQTVQIVHLESDGLEEIYRAMDCSLIDVVSLGGNIDLIVDDNGLLTDHQRYFKLGAVYAGICLVSANDGNGKVIDCPKTIGDIEEHLEWMPEDHTEEPYMEFIPLS